jgi:hypothetical protein
MHHRHGARLLDRQLERFFVFGPSMRRTEEDLVEPEISGEPRITKHGGNRASG